MINEKKMIGLAILAAAAWWIFRKATAATKLEYRVKSVRIKFYPDSVRILTDLELTNLTSTALQLEAITGEISANGKPVAKIDQMLKITIRPGITVLPLNFESRINQVSQLLFLDPKKLKINFTGSIKAEGLKIPVFYNYEP